MQVTAKFWAINAIAFIIVITYSIAYFMGDQNNTLLHITPFQLGFLGSLWYLISEGKLIQKLLLAKKLKDDDTISEFKIVDKASNAFDDNILDRFKKN